MKKGKIAYFLFCFAVLSSIAAFAQEKRTITGVVSDSASKPLPNVSVSLKGTSVGTSTSDIGAFTINAATGDTLVISALNYFTQNIIVNSSSTYNVQLVENKSTDLGEVVVTALGIKRSERSLSYQTQEIKSEQITSNKTDNFMNALNGKVAGLTISSSASGIGGSVKVNLRGLRSVSGSNQPLYVIDGIPINNNGNANSQPNSAYGGTPDGGDGISNLNPEDIASISVLEGASAAALYGSQAQNGVIMITTKSGGNKKIAVTFSSSETMSSIAYKPKFQNSFGQDTTSAMSPYSWGKKINSSNDNLDLFFQNGLNATNSISLSGGNEKAETYFSYANTSARGIQPTNKLQRNNFTFKEIGHFFDNKLTVEANIMYLTQTLNNSPYLGLYNNPLVGLYLFPRGVDLNQYKDNYINAEKTGYNKQNWLTQDPNKTGSTMTDEFGQNPWWILNKDPNVSHRNRYIIGVTAKYKFNNWMNLQVRGNVDRTSDSYEANYYQGSYQYINSLGKGALIWSEQTSQLKYADAILNLSQTNKSTPFQINGLIGTSINDYQMNGNANSDNSGVGYTNLNVADLFSIGNLYSAGGSVVFPFDSRYQIQSIFANANLSYKNLLYLTLTARNDWSSTLAFTKTNHFFYPSAGLSFVLSKLFNWDPSAVSFAKLRANYAIVGNGLTPFRSNPTSFNSGQGYLNVNTDIALDLKPEKTYSTELGLDLRFLNDRFNMSITYYNTNTKNQYFYIQAQAPSLHNYFSINAGNVRNRGLEFILGGNAIQNTHFTWSTSVNGSWINNKILELAPEYGLESYNLTGSNNFNFTSLVTTGGKFGDIYGTKFVKDDQGRIEIGGNNKVGADGKVESPYKVTSQNNQYLGNPMPKFTLGWTNDFTYNDFTLHVLVDGKFGGQVLSGTEAFMDQYGVSAVTGEARSNNNGMIPINGITSEGPISQMAANLYYQSVGGRGGIMENYIYSATVVRLREASIGYNFKLSPNAFFKKLRVSVFGRNLVYFHKKAPFDPEMTMSTGNGLSGVDLFGLPATRNVGLNFSLNF